VRARTPERLPVVLSRDEVGHSFAAVPEEGYDIRTGPGTARASGRADDDDVSACDDRRGPGSRVPWTGRERIHASLARIHRFLMELRGQNGATAKNFCPQVVACVRDRYAPAPARNRADRRVGRGSWDGLGAQP